MSAIYLSDNESVCTSFSLEAIVNGEIQEICVVVEADFIEGLDAACDEYGRPTEMGTDDSWDIQFLSVNGKEDPDITDLFVSAFLVWDNRLKAERPMKKADEFYQRCYEELYAELYYGDIAAGSVDDLPF